MSRGSLAVIALLAASIAGCSSSNKNPPTAPALPEAPRGGLVAEYTFTGNAADGTGGANDGIVSGGAALTTDRFGTANTAYLLDGVNDVITAAADQFAAGNTVSVSLWFKVPSTGVGLRFLVMCSDFAVWTNGANAGVSISIPATSLSVNLIPYKASFSIYSPARFIT